MPFLKCSRRVVTCGNIYRYFCLFERRKVETFKSLLAAWNVLEPFCYCWTPCQTRSALVYLTVYISLSYKDLDAKQFHSYSYHMAKETLTKSFFFFLLFLRKNSYKYNQNKKKHFNEYAYLDSTQVIVTKKMINLYNEIWHKTINENCELSYRELQIPPKPFSDTR